MNRKQKFCFIYSGVTKLRIEETCGTTGTCVPAETLFFCQKVRKHGNGEIAKKRFFLLKTLFLC